MVLKFFRVLITWFKSFFIKDLEFTESKDDIVYFKQETKPKWLKYVGNPYKKVPTIQDWSKTRSNSMIKFTLPKKQSA